jgi:CBS domain containing-hemolysin-like protein
VGWLLLAALVLLLVAGWCTAAETALLRVSRAGARELGRSAQDDTGVLPEVLAEAPRYLSVLLLARAAAEIWAAVLVVAVLVEWWGIGWRAFAVTAIVMTLGTYLLAGTAPRAVGRHNPVRVASAAARVLHPVVRVLGPLPRLLAAVGTALVPGRAARTDSEEEEDLRGLVDLLEQRQIIEPGEREMIHSVFELGDTIVREVMVPRTDMVFVERTKTLRQGLSLALRSGFSRIPVIGENLDDVVGMAYLKDIMTRIHEHPEGETVETVESIMRPATFAPESKPVDDLLRDMQARHVHVAIVIDEYGGTAGLVTIEDILEEIVGEIADEYDRELPQVEWLGSDEARVSARLPVEEFEALFGVRVEAQDVETVGGLLAHKLGKVPIAGSAATIEGLRLTAENLAGRRNRIGTVTVRRLLPEEPGGAPGGTQQQQPSSPQPARPGGATASGNGAFSAGKEMRHANSPGQSSRPLPPV